MSYQDPSLPMVSFYSFPAPSSADFPAGQSAYLSLDLRNMNLPADLLVEYKEQIDRALTGMQALEAGDIANPDEGRKVGHYWLRDPSLAKENSISQCISENWKNIVEFCDRVRKGQLGGKKGPFRNVLLIGIGGSALGPQLLASALGQPTDMMSIFFLDNTDPDGITRTVRTIQQTQAGLAGTLVIVASKSGATKETRNGQVEVQQIFVENGLNFSSQAIAVTMPASELHQKAVQEQWLAQFPIWDWVGGRTSLFSAVGLLPAALQGIDIFALLSGAKDMDQWTRRLQVTENPAMLLALAWQYMAKQGRKEMVVLPYKDRLELLSRYLQQLVMESLGKERDFEGHIVHEGIVVYGNKGSTDQHAYIQQLRDGVDRFFASFIQVQKDESIHSYRPIRYVEDHITSGDYLLGFLLGTRKALYENGRPSITITIPEVSAYTLGMLIALYERTVGYYAFLVGINAYNQPGVEAGKKAAGSILQLQQKLVKALSLTPQSIAELCYKCGDPTQEDTAFQVLEHLSMNGRIGRRVSAGDSPLLAKYHQLS